MNTAAVIAFVGLLVFLAHLFAGVFGRTRIPDVLFLILIGFVLGPLTDLVAPRHFGAVGPVFTVITLVIILFEAGLGLDVRELVRAVKGTAAVSVVNFAASVVVVAAVAYGLLDLGVRRSLMLGAMLGGTSSAVVIPLIQQLRLGTLARTILAMESAVTDVLCIVVALALLESVRLGSLDVGHMLGGMISALVLAAAAGVAAGQIWSVLLRRIRELKHSVFTTGAFVFVVFGVVELLGFSGAIASLAFGVTLGNPGVFRVGPLRRWLPAEPVSLTDTEKAFFGEAVFLLKTFFFVYIGLSLVLTHPQIVSVALVTTLLLFAVRAPVVAVSAPKDMTRADAATCAVMVPKGLAAAVLASLPVQQGVVGGAAMRDVAYAVVFFSIVLTSALVFMIDRTALGEAYRSAFRGFATGGAEQQPGAP
ncbi:MAG: cation:proton antiporter [Gemmatimonadetes bacterium]|nr:cation:proton antiporter [Gemmatimonadota bacterium]